MASLRTLVLMAFAAVGCGGSGSSNNNRDSSNPCPDMEQRYNDSSGKNKKKDMKDYDMNDTREDRYSDTLSSDSGRDCPDMGIDSSGDAGLEDRLDAGAPDIGMDMGVDAGRCPPREITYPFADLVCEAPDCRVNEDCLYEFSLRRERGYEFDASPSMDGPGRAIENYRFYPAFIIRPDISYTSPDPFITFGYDFTGEYSARLEVMDNLGDTGVLDYLAIVRD